MTKSNVESLKALLAALQQAEGMRAAGEVAAAAGGEEEEGEPLSPVL